MGCSAIHPGGERLPELLDEGPEEPNPARLAQARAEPGRGASYSSTVGGKVRPEEGPVAEEEAQGGRGGEDGGRPARGLCRGGGSHWCLGLRCIESHHKEPPHGGVTTRRVWEGQGRSGVRRGR